MNLIGPHRSDLPVHDLYPIVQTTVGSMQSLTVPHQVAMRHLGNHPYEVILHAAYVAAIAPKPESLERHADYLKGIIRHAGEMKVSKIVVHTGATVGREVNSILWAIEKMLGPFGIRAALEQANVELCVEVAANISSWNCNTHYVGAATAPESHVGWVLDLAHVYGTGVRWQRMCDLVEQYPPSLVHVNFPGTYFASSNDVHGWRHQPRLYKQGRKMLERSIEETNQLCLEWDSVVIFLKQRGIPMIVEGSSFPGDPDAELEFIKGLK